MCEQRGELRYEMVCQRVASGCTILLEIDWIIGGVGRVYSGRVGHAYIQKMCHD